MSVTDTAIAAATRRRRPRAEWFVIGLALAAVAWIALVPLVFLLWRTFVSDGSFSLDGVREAYGAFGLAEMAANSIIFAVLSTGLAVAVGTGLAYVVARTDAPWKPVLFALALVPVAVPGVLYAIAWVFLASPRTGLLNKVLEPIFGPGTLNIFGMGGMIFVESLRLVPLCVPAPLRRIPLARSGARGVGSGSRCSPAHHLLARGSAARASRPGRGGAHRGRPRARSVRGAGDRRHPRGRLGLYVAAVARGNRATRRALRRLVPMPYRFCCSRQWAFSSTRG